MKNKEIEELLNKLQRRKERYDYCKNNDISFSNEDYKSYLLLSYIEQLENLCNKYEQEHKTTFEIWKKDIKKLEQLETDYKEAIESVTWWHNRFNAVERDNKNLKNNRDKAIEFIEKYRTHEKIGNNDYLKGRDDFGDLDRWQVFELIDILKGDSDD